MSTCSNQCPQNTQTHSYLLTVLISYLSVEWIFEAGAPTSRSFASGKGWPVDQYCGAASARSQLHGQWSDRTSHRTDARARDVN